MERTLHSDEIRNALEDEIEFGSDSDHESDGDIDTLELLFFKIIF